MKTETTKKKQKTLTLNNPTKVSTARLKRVKEYSEVKTTSDTLYWALYYACRYIDSNPKQGII